MKEKSKSKHTSVRLGPESAAKLDWLRDHLGLGGGKVFEVAVRRLYLDLRERRTQAGQETER